MANVTVDVDVHAHEFDDDELVEELIERGYTINIPAERFEKISKWKAERLRKLKCAIVEETPPDEELEAVRSCILDRRVGDALALLDAMLAPKFRSIDECEKKYAEAMNRGVAA